MASEVSEVITLSITSFGSSPSSLARARFTLTCKRRIIHVLRDVYVGDARHGLELPRPDSGRC